MSNCNVRLMHKVYQGTGATEIIPVYQLPPNVDVYLERIFITSRFTAACYVEFQLSDVEDTEVVFASRIQRTYQDFSFPLGFVVRAPDYPHLVVRALAVGEYIMITLIGHLLEDISDK